MDQLLILPTRDILEGKKQELVILESCDVTVDHVMDFVVDIWSMWNAPQPVPTGYKALYESAFESIYEKIGEEFGNYEDSDKNKIIANCTDLALQIYQELKPAMDVACVATTGKLEYLGIHGWLGNDLVVSINSEFPDTKV